MASPWQDRVIREQKKLEEKLARLGEFFGTDTYRALPRDDARLLRMQFRAMQAYQEILMWRIERFGSEDEK